MLLHAHMLFCLLFTHYAFSKFYFGKYSTQDRPNNTPSMNLVNVTRKLWAQHRHVALKSFARVLFASACWDVLFSYWLGVLCMLTSSQSPGSEMSTWSWRWWGSGFLLSKGFSRRACPVILTTSSRIQGGGPSQGSNNKNKFLQQLCSFVECYYISGIMQGYIYPWSQSYKHDLKSSCRFYEFCVSLRKLRLREETYHA